MCQLLTRAREDMVSPTPWHFKLLPILLCTGMKLRHMQQSCYRNLLRLYRCYQSLRLKVSFESEPKHAPIHLNYTKRSLIRIIPNILRQNRDLEFIKDKKRRRSLKHVKHTCKHCFKEFFLNNRIKSVYYNLTLLFIESIANFKYQKVTFDNLLFN